MYYRICVSAYASTENNNDIVNIKATTCNCIVVAQVKKMQDWLSLVRSRGPIIFNQRYYSQFF